MDTSNDASQDVRLAAFRALVTDSVAAAEAAGARARASLEESMRARTAVQRDFDRIAARLIESELAPRVTLIAECFPGATVEQGRTANGVHVRCRLASSARFPASVQFTIGVLLDAARGTGSVTFRLEVVPLLTEIEPAHHLDFVLQDASLPPLVDWVELRLIGFIHFYLGLETDERYQRADAGIDPVCGMKLTPATAAERIVERAHTWYFCSTACRAVFEADRAVFAGAHGDWKLDASRDAPGAPDGTGASG